MALPPTVPTADSFAIVGRVLARPRPFFASAAPERPAAAIRSTTPRATAALRSGLCIRLSFPSRDPGHGRPQDVVLRDGHLLSGAVADSPQALEDALLATAEQVVQAHVLAVEHVVDGVVRVDRPVVIV